MTTTKESCTEDLQGDLAWEAGYKSIESKWLPYWDWTHRKNHNNGLWEVVTIWFRKTECLINEHSVSKKLHATGSLVSAFQQRPAFFVVPFSFFRKSLCTCTQNSIKRGEYQSERLGGVERGDKGEEGNRAKCQSPSFPPPPVKWPSSCSPDSFLWPVRSNCSVCVLPARPELWEPGDLDSRLKCRAGERSSLETLTMRRVSHELKAEKLHSPCVVRSSPPLKHPPLVLQACCPYTGWPLLPTDTLHPLFDICSYICPHPS